jgi:hypothetical protein
MADVKTDTEATPAPKKQVTIVLTTEFLTNRVSYGPGQVTVDEDIAEDLMRRQELWNKVERFRLEGKDYTVKEALATFDAGGK